MRANQNIVNFDTFMPIYKKDRKAEKSKDADIESFAMPFSSNSAKRYCVFAKYRAITKFMLKKRPGNVAFDFGPSFGAFLPRLFSRFNDVIAVDTFDIQVIAARELVTFMELPKIKVEKVRKDKGLLHFDDGKFDIKLAADAMEHNPNYKDIAMELKMVLRLGGSLIVSLPMEHLLYRLFAGRRVNTMKKDGVSNIQDREMIRSAPSFPITSREFTQSMCIHLFMSHILPRSGSS
ncbi:hypothetical protein Thermo_00525 [Thermoplasmatales archaeon]|nr:hypothetical protein Thermo_00525 [Thermoplasmatales archaeon]